MGVKLFFSESTKLMERLIQEWIELNGPYEIVDIKFNSWFDKAQYENRHSAMIIYKT